MRTESWIVYFCCLAAITTAAFINGFAYHLPMWLSWIPYLAMCVGFYFIYANIALLTYKRRKRG